MHLKWNHFWYSVHSIIRLSYVSPEKTTSAVQLDDDLSRITSVDCCRILRWRKRAKRLASKQCWMHFDVSHTLHLSYSSPVQHCMHLQCWKHHIPFLLLAVVQAQCKLRVCCSLQIDCRIFELAVLEDLRLILQLNSGRIRGGCRKTKRGG